MLFHRNTGAWFIFVLSWGLVTSVFAFYSTLLVMEMDILIKVVIPVRRQNVASFDKKLLTNVSKQGKKKIKKKIHFTKDF